jgi:uncharacterized damage-inducible protein DinB
MLASTAAQMNTRLVTVQALWSLFQGRDWVAARRLLADHARMTWHTSGERLLDADAIIRVNAIYPEGWRIRLLEINALQDGRVHSVVEVNHAPNRFIANSLFRFEGERIAEVDEYWATVEAPPAWRTAAAIGAYERFDLAASEAAVAPFMAPGAGERPQAQPQQPPSPLRDHLATLARYNLWATRQLFAHIDALPEADYRKDMGLFFQSVHATLNHLLVGEHRLWFRRFSEGVSPQLALNAEVEPDRARLRHALLEGAACWLPFIEACDASRFEGTLDYTTMRGVPASLPFAATLAHVFNHATHHRGQITVAITALGHPCPEIDMVWMLQAESARA